MPNRVVVVVVIVVVATSRTANNGLGRQTSSSRGALIYAVAEKATLMDQRVMVAARAMTRNSPPTSRRLVACAVMISHI